MSDIGEEIKEIRKASKIVPLSTSYHVHQAVLGVGPRKSQFFADFFRSKRKEGRSNFEDNTIHIEVKRSASEAFPVLLDFVYSPPNSPLETRREFAVALRHLGTVLGIRELFENATKFIAADIAANTSPLYMVEADTFGHEKVGDAALRICASKFQDIKFSNLILLTPKLFENVLHAPNFKCDSEVLSNRVASYCRCRVNEITIPILMSLTGDELMPCIAADESLYFLNILSQLGEESANNSLYKKCIKSSAKPVLNAVNKPNSSDCGTISNSQSKRMQNISRNAEYECLSSSVKVDILEHALRKSEHAPYVSEHFPYAPERSRYISDHASCTAKQLSPRIAKSSHSKISPRTKNQSQNSIRFQDEERETQSTQRQKDMKMKEKIIRNLENLHRKEIYSYEKVLAHKEETIKMLYAELSKFTRLPCEYTTPSVLCEHTYKEEPLYTSYGDSIYGYEPPSAFPKSCPPEKDGWVMNEDTWNGKTFERNKWPIYFYRGNAN